MPRPCKKRRICGMPKTMQFAPRSEEDAEVITLAFDEYEVLRLIDLEGFTQEECARQMNISRASVSAICETAHRKMAEMLVYSRQLHIDGGHVTICEQASHCCGNCGKGNCSDCSKLCSLEQTGRP